MRPCLQCGRATSSTRCPRCTKTKDRGRNATRTQYQSGWERRSRDTRATWVAEHGWICAGLGEHQPHPALDLELDHTTGRVLCHQANVNAGPAGPDAAIPHP